MNHPLISEYIEAIKAAEDNFEQLKNLRPILGENGEPVMTSGNFAVVFKMMDEQTGKFHAVKCFLKEQEGRAEAYRMIAEELEFVNSTFLTPIKYLDKELFVDTSQTDETEFPVLLMDWVDGVTLDKYIREHIDEQYELSLLAYQFSRLAMWLIPQPFAHGDLKPDNILVKNDGTLVLVDYDGMYVPAMKGQKARELGSPDFRHPSRTETDFDEHIDDFSLVSIILSLKAIALQPELLEQYGASYRLLFSANDYRNIIQCQILREIFPSTDSELNILQTLFTLALEKGNLSDVSFRLLNLSRPKEPEFENLSTEVTEEDLANAWTDEYGVMYSKDRKRLLCVYGSYLPDYEIPEGTEVICDDSLNGFGSEIEGLMISGKIIIPSSVRLIGRNPFRGDYDTVICKSPHFVVENGALYTSNRKRLISCFSKESEFIIPDGVEQIGSFAFYDCDISRILIPESVSYIGDNPLISLNYLSQKPIEVVSQSRFFKLTENTLYDEKNKTLISFFGKGKHLSVLEGTRIIKDYAFGYTDLEYLSLPNSIDTIGHYIFFYAWENLKTILIPNGSTKNFEELLPEYKDKLVEKDDLEHWSTKVTEEDLENAWTDEYGVKYSSDKRRLLKAPNYPPDFNYFSESTIRKGTKVICDKAFSSEYSILATLNIPDSVKSIGFQAFLDCCYLQSIYIPKNVSQIGARAFDGCYRLTTIIVDKDNETYDSRNNCCAIIETKTETLITGCSSSIIPNGVKHIGDYAFFGQSILNSVTFPDSLVSIGKYAFYGTGLSTIIIPDSVTNIDEGAFFYCDKLKSIILPEHISTISPKTFEGCENLSSIEIPQSVTSIGSSAFEGCSGLESILIPEKVTNIGISAFCECKSLIKINIPSGITIIRSSTFKDCHELKSFIIPVSVTKIDNDAFSGCISLKSIVIPKDVVSIGNGAFSWCNNLSSIVVDISNVKYDSRDNCNAIIKSETDTLIAGCSSTVIPYTVSEIGPFAFEGCTQMESIIIPNGVSTIGNYAFKDCIRLTSIIIPESITRIGYNAFDSCDKLEIISLPDSITSIDSSIFRDCESLKCINIPHDSYDKFIKLLPEYQDLLLSTEVTDDDLENGIKDKYGTIYSKDGYRLLKGADVEEYDIRIGVKVICDYAFSGCKTLSAINLPDSLVEIGRESFRWCLALKRIVIPDSVISIGQDSFTHCTSLTQISISNSLKRIEEGAFSDCKSLNSINIPNSVKEIGHAAFSGCTNLETIKMPLSVISIGALAFEQCKFRNIIIPNSVRLIGYSAFGSCSSLEEIILPNSIDTIDGLFEGCKSLINIYIPESVRLIKGPAFRGCKSLASIVIPENVTTIDYSTFEGCSGLTSITIPDSVTSIGNFAFSGCDSLTTVIVPDEVTTIKDYAFSKCEKLTEVAIPVSVKSIGIDVFNECKNLSKIIIPNGTKEKFEELLPEYKHLIIEKGK